MTGRPIRGPYVQVDDTWSISWRWTAGIAIFVILALVGGWAGTVQLRLTSIEGSIIARNERISALETRVSLLESQYKEIRDLLKGIAEKQDIISKELAEHRMEGRNGGKMR